jgi:hypothetical protein
VNADRDAAQNILPAGLGELARATNPGGDQCPNASGQLAAQPVGLGVLVRFPVHADGKRTIAVRWPGVKVLVEHGSESPEDAACALARMPFENEQLRAENAALREIIKNAAACLEAIHG